MMAPPLDGPRRDATGKAEYLVVLLHGFGADGRDLIELAGHWQKQLPQAAFAAPNALERCAMAGSGFQWFSLAQIDPRQMVEGADGATPALNAFLDAELQRLSLPPERLALVGFSQGTMMALHVGLKRAPSPAVIVGFSGLLIAPAALPHFPENPTPIFLSHGDADQMLPPQSLFEASIALGAAGFAVQWHLAQGVAHGIDPETLEIAGTFLRQALLSKRATVGPVCCHYPKPD